MDYIDEIIAIIRSSRTEAEAKVRMCERFGLSDKQAQHIVDMRLGRLTGLEREKLEAEIKALTEEIEYFHRVLSDKTLLDDIIKTEMTEIKNKYATPRVSEIINGSFEDIDDESLIAEENIVVTLTHFGYIKRQRVDSYKAQHRGGRGISGQSTREEDYVEKIITTTTHKFLLCFTNTGRVFKIKGYKIPETTSRSARGTALVNLLNLNDGETIRNIIPIDSFEEPDLYLTTVTKYGVIKKTSIDKYANINRNGLIATKIREGDSVVAVQLTKAGQEVIVVSAAGKSVRFNSDDARDMGRGATGVRAMKLADDDEVVGMEPVDPSREILVISELGYGKRSKIDDYRVQSRGGKGIITYKVSEKTGRLCGTVSVTDDDDLLIITSQGVIIRVRANEIPTLSRATSGVKLMKSNKARVVDFALTDREIEEPDELEEGAEGAEGALNTEVSLETEDGLSPNARKVQEFADTLAAEIEAEDIAAPEDSEDSSKNEEDDDI